MDSENIFLTVSSAGLGFDMVSIERPFVAFFAF